MTKFRIIALLSALSLASFAEAVSAATPHPDGLRRQTVRYADLDLGAEDGARTALQRIRWAANRVCGSPGSAREYRDQRECKAKAIADAVKATKSPMMAAIHDGNAAAILLARK